MKKLNDLKRKYGISILVLAHPPKRRPSDPLSINDLAGSKHLSNFADSVFAIGKSNKDKNFRYLKQIKPSRSGEPLYDSENIVVCTLKKDNNFLTLDFISFGTEKDHLSSYNDGYLEEQILQAKSLKQEGKTIREIETIIGVSKSQVHRWLSK